MRKRKNCFPPKTGEIKSTFPDGTIEVVNALSGSLPGSVRFTIREPCLVGRSGPKSLLLDLLFRRRFRAQVRRRAVDKFRLKYGASWCRSRHQSLSYLAAVSYFLRRRLNSWRKLTDRYAEAHFEKEEPGRGEGEGGGEGGGRGHEEKWSRKLCPITSRFQTPTSFGSTKRGPFAKISALHFLECDSSVACTAGKLMHGRF